MADERENRTKFDESYKQFIQVVPEDGTPPLLWAYEALVGVCRMDPRSATHPCRFSNGIQFGCRLAQ
jgi:hypothetical protein